MTQEELAPETAIFLDSLKAYFDGEPRVINNGKGKEKVWKLKHNVLADGPAAATKLRMDASRVGATFTSVPLQISVPYSTEPSRDEIVDLYLTEDQLEDGGPQPRTKIDINDSKIKELYDSLDKYGQLDPCKAYPSPTTPGKYRLRDGHCRKFILLNLLRKNKLWVVSQERSPIQVYKDAFILNNNRNNLSAYDQGHYIQEVLMKMFPKEYPNQTAVAKELGISQQLVSFYMSAYNEVEAQKAIASVTSNNAYIRISQS